MGRKPQRAAAVGDPVMGSLCLGQRTKGPADQPRGNILPAFPEPFFCWLGAGLHTQSLFASYSTDVECRLFGSGSKSEMSSGKKVEGTEGLHGQGKCGETQRENMQRIRKIWMKIGENGNHFGEVIGDVPSRP